MKYTKSKLGILTLVMVVAVGGTYRLCVTQQHAKVGNEGKSPILSDEADNAEASTVTVQPLTRQIQNRIGQRLLYRATFQAETRGTNDRTAKDTAVGSAMLSLSIATEQAHELEYTGQFSEVSIVTDGENTPDDYGKPLSDSLTTSFMLKASSTGSIKTIAFSPKANRLGDGILRGFAATFQFIRPTERERLPAAWNVPENDNLGTYLALYERTGEGRFRKTANQYQSLVMNSFLNTGSSENAPNANVSGEYQVDSEGILKLASLSQTVTLPKARDGAVVIHASYRLEYVGTDRNGSVIAGSERWPREALGAIAQRKGGAPSERENRKLLGNATWETLTQDMKDAINKGDDDSRLKSADRMSALFALEPKRARDAALAMRHVRDPKEAQTVLGALADTHNAEALSALEEVADDKAVSDDVRGHALGHLGLHDEPNEKTLETLTKIANKETNPVLKEQAVLSMGSVAGKLLSNNDTADTATRTLSDIKTQLVNAKTPAAQAVYLKALGNAGGIDALSGVAAKLSDSDARVRQAAVLSLRFVPGQEADAFLVNALLEDSESVVRATAAQAASFRSPSAALLKALGQSAQNDPAVEVRGSVLQCLSSFLTQTPVEARALLEWISKNAPTAEEREEAQRILKFVV